MTTKHTIENIGARTKPSRLAPMTAEQYLNISIRRNKRLKKIRNSLPFPTNSTYLKSYIEATQDNAETDSEIFNYLLKG